MTAPASAPAGELSATLPVAASSRTPSTPGRLGVAAVADGVIALMRSFGRVKARVLAAAEHDVEWSAHFLLRALQTDGPQRASELAAFVQVDPSTVSRQVAALVRAGLLERQADPADGRASLLVLTDKAHAVLADHTRLRMDVFARMLHDWSDDDLEQFGALLSRFTAAYDRVSTDWPPGQSTARPEPNQHAEGEH